MKSGLCISGPSLGTRAGAPNAVAHCLLFVERS